MLPERELRQADVVGAILLAALGVLVVAGALTMPLSGTHGGSPVYWYTSPAILPLVLGLLLIGFSAAVFVRAVRRGGLKDLGAAIRRSLGGLHRHERARRVATLWLLIGAYILLLAAHPFAWLARVFDRLIFMRSSFATEPEVANYIPCSTLFLAAFMLLFYYRSGTGSRARRAAIVAVLSVTVPWLVAYAFKVHLYAPLPW